ncbi:MAG TPA: PQQ-binding-like beta-propeller repeat protein, partial [Verrucomicrobiae bacterium]|nr:PQQ-binding-like beta-propeller repeat protein [Verrucomicrobiae bacterium]
AIGADGTIYFGSHDKKIYALKPDGELRWSFLTGGQIISSPAIGGDGAIYFTSTDGNLYALRPDGAELWRLHTGGATESSPVLDGQGVIYLAVNKLYFSVTEDGKKRWDWHTTESIGATPAVTGERMVCFSSPEGEFSEIQPDEFRRWALAVHESFTASPVIGSDGTIYACSRATLRAITANDVRLPAKSSWPMWRANAQHTGRVQTMK